MPIRIRLRVPPARILLLVPLLLIGFLMRWPFMHGRVTPELEGDTIGYFGIADRMADGHLFAASGSARGPGYPVFVVLTDLFGGAREVNLVSVQHVLGLLVAGGVLLWAWQAIDRPTAILSGALLALSPIMFIVEDEALPDFLLGALLLVFAISLAVASLRPPSPTRWRWLAAAGVVLGFAALTKPIAQAALLAPPITLAFAAWPRYDLARGSLIILAAFAVVVSPFVMHSLIRFGEPSLTQQSGVTLFVREFEIGGRPIPTDTRDGQIVDAAIQGTAQAGVQQRTYVTGLQALERVRGIDSRAATRRERALAMHAIAQHPFAYAWQTIRLSDRFLYEMLGSARLAEPHLPRAGANDTSAAHSIWSVGEWLTNRWWALSMHGIVLLFALTLGPRRRRTACAALISTGALVALATAALHGGLPRYSWALAPLTYTAGFAGIVIAARAIWHGAHDVRRGI
jgi:4-amino-4-deoxy-L-arabinose transferase-like glycosyltransferase